MSDENENENENQSSNNISALGWAIIAGVLLFALAFIGGMLTGGNVTRRTMEEIQRDRIQTQRELLAEPDPEKRRELQDRLEILRLEDEERIRHQQEQRERNREQREQRRQEEEERWREK